MFAIRLQNELELVAEVTILDSNCMKPYFTPFPTLTTWFVTRFVFTGVEMYSLRQNKISRNFHFLSIFSHLCWWAEMTHTISENMSVHPSVRPSTIKRNVATSQYVILVEIVKTCATIWFQGHPRWRSRSRALQSCENGRFWSVSPPPFVEISWILLMIIIIWDNI